MIGTGSLALFTLCVLGIVVVAEGVGQLANAVVPGGMKIPDLAPLPPPTGTLQEPRPPQPPLKPPGGPVCTGTVCRVAVVTAAGAVTYYFYSKAAEQGSAVPQPAPPPK